MNNEPVITASPSNVKEPVTSNEPLTSVFALVNSKFFPLGEKLADTSIAELFVILLEILVAKSKIYKNFHDKQIQK